MNYSFTTFQFSSLAPNGCGGDVCEYTFPPSKKIPFFGSILPVLKLLLMWKMKLDEVLSKSRQTSLLYCTELIIHILLLSTFFYFYVYVGVILSSIKTLYLTFVQKCTLLLKCKWLSKPLVTSTQIINLHTLTSWSSQRNLHQMAETCYRQVWANHFEEDGRWITAFVTCYKKVLVDIIRL